MKFLTGLTILIMMFTAGCTMQNSPAQKPQAQQQQFAKENVIINTELAGQAEKTANTIEAVEDSVAVAINSDISIAVKVTGFDRLRLKSIRKGVHEKISQIAPEHTIHVTTDKKLFFELQKLTKQIRKDGNPAQIKSKLETINNNMQG